MIKEASGHDAKITNAKNRKEDASIIAMKNTSVAISALPII